MVKNFYIYESELRAMAYEAGKYPDCETGGDLYGLWTAEGCPVVFLATGPGPNAIHQDAHYQMDIAYEQQCESILIQQFGIHYLGDWHSHHKLGLYEPSGGDRQRIQNIFYRNSQVTHMAEIIINHAGGGMRQEIVSAYIYDRLMCGSHIKCLETPVSPIRDKLKRLPAGTAFNLIGRMYPADQIIFNVPDKPRPSYCDNTQYPLPAQVKSAIRIKIER